MLGYADSVAPFGEEGVNTVWGRLLCVRRRVWIAIGMLGEAFPVSESITVFCSLDAVDWLEDEPGEDCKA